MLLAVGLIAAPIASPCAAQEAEPSAISLFERAAAAYDRGDFTESVELLERAYALQPEPVIHYNLARAHEGLGQLEDAIEHFERYLEEAEDIRDRGAIERRLETLRGLLAERRRLQREHRREDPVTPPPFTEAPASTSPSPWPWIVAGLGVVGVGVGVGVGLLATERREQADLEPTHRGALAIFAEAEDLALAANITFAVAGIAALVGVIWGVVDVATIGDDDDAGASLRLRVDGLALHGAWR